MLQKMRKSEKGVTLVVLVLTIIILSILSFTVLANVGTLSEKNSQTKLEEDIHSLFEKIEQYYARNNKLPVANAFTNISMLQDCKNVNDNDKYYVIDIIYLKGLDLHYGKEYYDIRLDKTGTKINTCTDVYIINEASHTIYYPKGMQYNGKMHYCLDEVYTAINY